MTKRKHLSRIFTLLLAALLFMDGLSVTAYAQTPASDDTDDSGIVTQPQPLTPEGNMTLVDDISGDAAKDKQFIVVKSRGGNYFYIVIDNAAEGENRVHFLNQVDEADLLSIIDEDLQSIRQTPEPEVTPAPQITQPEPATEPEQPKKDQSILGNLLIFLAVILLGGGGAVLYLKVIKPKQSVKGDTDLDEFDFDEWDEDEPEADTESNLPERSEDEQEDEV